MADLFRCQHCGGTGELITTTNQETLEYRVEDCLSCGGFGFVSSVDARTRRPVVMDPIELALNAIKKVKAEHEK